jgi:predicted DNA-binding protein with PD1-like motif
MKHFSDAASDTHLLVLRKGEEIMQQLTAFATEQRLPGAWVDIVGGAAGATLGYFDPTAREYRWRTYDEPLEITGLHGNLAYVYCAATWHLLCTFARSDYSVIGGHVKECPIGLTGEILLTTRRDRLTRVFDDETGLKLLSEA